MAPQVWHAYIGLLDRACYQHKGLNHQGYTNMTKLATFLVDTGMLSYKNEAKFISVDIEKQEGIWRVATLPRACLDEGVKRAGSCIAQGLKHRQNSQQHCIAPNKFTRPLDTTLSFQRDIASVVIWRWICSEWTCSN